MKNKNLFLSICFIAISAIGFAQTQKATNLLVGDTSGSVETTAALEVESTTQGFLPPRMNSTEMAAITTPAEGLVVYCTNCVPKGLYVSNGTGFADLSGTPDQTGVPAGAVRSTTGAVWQTMNLGATSVGTHLADDDAKGSLYQWGRATDGHESRTSTIAAGPVAAGTEGADFITSTPANDNDWLSTADDTRWQTAASPNNPCDAGFRIPTAAEFQAEIATFSTPGLEGAFNSPLKFVATAYRIHHTGNMYTAELSNRGLYWSSTQASATRIQTLDVRTSGYNATPGYSRGYAFAVRCIQD